MPKKKFNTEIAFLLLSQIMFHWESQKYNFAKEQKLEIIFFGKVETLNTHDSVTQRFFWYSGYAFFIVTQFLKVFVLLSNGYQKI